MSKAGSARPKKPTEEEVLAGLRLPTKGVAFEPPKNWFPTQPLPRGPQNGYMDRHGREWVHGPSRTSGQHFEWDVQLPQGGHLNVDWGGNITHPKPKKVIKVVKFAKPYKKRR